MTYNYLLCTRKGKQDYNNLNIKNMQVNEKSDNAQRTFADIWKGLTPERRNELFTLLLGHGCCSTFTTPYNWAFKGKRPISLALRKKAAKIVSDYVGERFGYEELFPYNKK